MENPFLKISKDKKVALQQYAGGKVEKRQVGRPRKPGMGRYSIRILESLHREISALCERRGIGISEFIRQSVVNEFARIKKGNLEN